MPADAQPAVHVGENARLKSPRTTLMQSHAYIELARGVEYDAWVPRLVLALAVFFAPALARAQDAGVADAPKVAVVVVGDADAPLRSAAQRIEEALTSVRLPADPALRGALHGDPAPAEDDGLDGVRAARHRLGRSEAEDLPSLLELARVTGAVVLVVVRVPLGGAGVEAVTLDVGARQFFVGSLDPATAEPEVMERYVAARARDAVSREGSEPPAVSPPTHPRPSHPRERPPASGSPSGDIGQWFSRNWVFLLIGAAVGAAAIALIVAAQPSDPGPPVLRFQFGGS